MRKDEGIYVKIYSINQGGTHYDTETMSLLFMAVERREIMKNRYSAIFILLIFALTFAVGCGNGAVKDNSSESIRQSSQIDNKSDLLSEPEPDSSIKSESVSDSETNSTSGEKKAAVVYFSATGTTKDVATLIAKEAEADIFEIIPEEDYTSEDLNYNDDNCRANKEMNDDKARPAISEDMSVVSEYDVIYLGYPIWWGTAPRVIQTFLESYDISRATVYTFCTSGGSGIEKSIKDLKSLYSDVNIVSGKRFSKAEEADIKKWLAGLN